MCGIAGIVSENGFSNHGEMVRRMCNIMHHRGPDDVGVYKANGCVLGQARLSIIDIAGGHQPMSNEDGTIWITFNGEIYNYLELRGALIAKGHEFSTTTDTEVIVHLYEESGIDCLDELNGMFAFALWDSKQQCLFLVRDRLGIKPLYYCKYGETLSFASEMKALYLVLGQSFDVDKEAIAEYLTLGYIPDPRTAFSNIAKLSAGSYIKYSKGRTQCKRYWSVPRENGHSQVNVEELAEQMAFLIRDSARLQLRSDVPVGLFASGGIDSTAIMWAASQQNVRLDAFLVEFDQLKADSPYARVAAEATGMKLIENNLSCQEAGKLLPRLIWHLDEPLADPAIVPCYLIAKSAVDKVKVILNGTGGDELFGGYPRYNVRGFLPDPWSYPIGRFFTDLNPVDPWTGKIGAALDYRQRYLRRLSVFPEKSVRSALGLDKAGSISRLVNNLFSECLGNDPPGSMMYVDINLYLPSNLFMLLDKMTMAVSLEARVPLVDHRLVELMSATPGRLKMRGKELKWLLRKALRGHIPDQILDRPKQGFGPPLSKWLDGEFGSLVRKLLTGRKSRLVQIFGEKCMERWQNKDRSQNSSQAMRTWSLLVLELWWRVFVDGADISSASVHDLAEDAEARWI